MSEVLPFGEYLPDQADFGNPGGVNFINAIPKVGSHYPTYGPVKDLVGASDALAARCQGAGAGMDTSRNVSLFAGDATKLYELVDGVWTDRSIGGGYSTSASSVWHFEIFGNRMMATNYDDAPQTFVMGVDSAFSNLASGAPKARYITMMDPYFLVLGNINDTGGDGVVPNRVQWSAGNDPTDFPTPGTADAQQKESDYNDMHSGNQVQGVIGGVGGASGAVFMDNTIFRADYIGPRRTYRFTEIERSRGCDCPESIVNVGPYAFFHAVDGFRIFDGAQSLPIGEGKVDQKFNGELDTNYLERVSAAVDPVNKLYWIVYPGPGNSGGNPNFGLVYQWELRRWSPFEFDGELLAQILTAGYTLDGLDDLGYTIDTLPFSLDSRVWTGGANILAAFTTLHKLAFFTGDNKAATFETGEVNDAEFIKYVDGLRPMIDGGSPTACVGYRDAPGDAVQYTTATDIDVDGYCPQHIAARYIRAKVQQPAGESWEHAIGVAPRMKSNGKR